MSISSTDIKFYLTPSGNTSPNASLGGAGEGSQIGTSINNIFRNVTPEEAVSGVITYRAIEAKNTNNTDTLYGAYLWVSLLDTDPNTTIDIGVDSGTQAIATEFIAPSSPVITFSHPTSKASGISLGDLTSGTTVRIWMRRTVSAGASSDPNDNGSITIGGGTA
jgi:hypothetical protein